MSLVMPRVASLSQVTQLRKNTQMTISVLPSFENRTLLRLSNEITLREIHSRMRAANYSEKIIQGTTILRVSVVSKRLFRIFFRSEYFTENGFDVAFAREHGTTRHFVKPVSKQALHWNGDKFSKGHFVEGIETSNIIRDSLNETAQQVQSQYILERREFINDSMSKGM